MEKTGSIEAGKTPCVVCGDESSRVNEDGDAICSKCVSAISTFGSVPQVKEASDNHDNAKGEN